MFEMMLISAGGLWLGFFGLVVLSGILWASSVDSFILGLGVIFVSLVSAEFLFAIPIWATIVANPFILIMYIVFYGTVGAIYTALWRLPNYIKKNGDRIQYDYDSWKQNQDGRNRKGHDETRNTTFEAFLNSTSYNYSVKDNKDRVASWVLLWPISLMWELIHKPVVWLWGSVYFGLGKVFEKINHDQAKKILENNKK